MKKIAYFLLLGAFALVLSGCPDVNIDIDDEDINTITNGQEDSGETDGEETNEEGEVETGDETGEETGGETVGISGDTVTAVSNCVFFIEGDRFTASGDYSTPTYRTTRIPVTLASGSDDQVEPVGEAIVFGRLIMQDAWSVYYLLKGKNTSSDDFQYVYARGLTFIDNGSSYSKRIDSTLYGHLREIDLDNQVSKRIGLRPDDTGYFFNTSAVSITGTDLDSIDRAELTTSLGLNIEEPNSYVHTEVDAEIEVLEYRYGERDGVLGLTISIRNTGDTIVQLNRNPSVFLWDGDNVTLYSGSFSRIPSAGQLQPGETGGYFKAASDLGNASADKVMIILDYQDPPL